MEPIHHRTYPPARGALHAVVVAASFAAVACGNDTGGEACTLIGCEDLVYLKPTLKDGTPAPYVNGKVTIGSKEIMLSCGADTPGTADYSCLPDGVQLRGKPLTFKVKLYSGDWESAEETVTPTYSKAQPNGPKCDPICAQAVVTIVLAGGGLTDVVSDGSSSDAGSNDAGGSDGGASDSGAADSDDDASDTSADAASDVVDASDTGSDVGVDASDDAGSDVGVDASDAAGTDAGPSDAGPKCCTGTEDCAEGHCIAGECYKLADLGQGQCWIDGDCATGESCSGVITCPCGAMCFAASKPGTCTKTAAAGDCCDGNKACGPGLFCAKTTCKALADLGAGQCWGDAQCGGGEQCVGAVVCSCAAMCPGADKPGLCQKGTCVTVDPKGYGSCKMLIGFGFDGTACVSIGGCGCADKDNCAGIWPDLASCQASCGLP